MIQLNAFHYRSYGTFFLHSKKLHNLHGGFTHYRNYRASYYYLTDDDSIEIGDFVLVPAGKDNHEAVVEVVNIEYFSEENVPLPIEKTKRIIRKCTDDDFDLPESE